MGDEGKAAGFRITGGFAVSELPYSAVLSKRGKPTLDRSRRMSAKGQKEETLLNFDVRFTPESELPKLITCPPFSVDIASPGPLRQIRECRSRLQLLMLMDTLC
jgi:hypothetical protein